MDEELISVIIPCFNGEKYLYDCLNSLLNQTYKFLEVIIVDDGSTDNSKEIINEYINQFYLRNKKLIYLYQKNMGQAVAVNMALKKITGKYLVWQDCDDYYELDALEELHNYLLKNSDCDFVRGESVNRLENNMNEIFSYGKSKYPKQKNVFELYLFEKDTYTYPGVIMVRMEYFDKCIHGREIYESPIGQNWQLILPLAYGGKCGYLNKIVYNYRIVENSHFHSVKKIKDQLERCDNQRKLLINVINSIEKMPEKEKIHYVKKIKNRYVIKKIRIFLSRIKRLIKR